MLIATAFGVSLVLLGVIAWEDLRLGGTKFEFKA